MLAFRLAVGLGAAVTLLAGCGTETVERPADAAPSATTQPERPAPPPPPPQSPHFTLPDYGVEPTTTRVLAPGEVTCASPVAAATVDVAADAPGSPTAIVAVPDGFTAAARVGVGELTLAGPDGMTATVEMTSTDDDAQAAFQRYAEERTGSAAINSVSVLPGDLCGYSGQELIGILAERPGEGIDYADRIVHVWTNDGNFLIAVRLEAPIGSGAVDETRSEMLADFGIRMPD